MNALDEVSQSYSYQGNLELDQTRHTIETWDHEYVDSEMIRLLSRVCAFYEGIRTCNQGLSFFAFSH